MKNKLMLGAATIVAVSYAAVIAVPVYADPPAGIILAQDRTAPGTPGTKPPTAADRRAEDAMRERTARLQAAQPLAQANVSADAVIGTEVRNTQDQKLGSVKDLVMTDGKIVGLILARGGVLGMGTSYHQIDSAHAKITADVKTVVLDLADEQAKALPKVEYKDGKWAQVIDDKASPPSTAPAAPPSRSTAPPATDKKIDPPAGTPSDKTEPPAKSQ